LVHEPNEVVLGYRGSGQHPNWDALPEVWIWQHRVEDDAADEMREHNHG